LAVPAKPAVESEDPEEGGDSCSAFIDANGEILQA
jgi:hypothetical protein